MEMELQLLTDVADILKVRRTEILSSFVVDLGKFGNLGLWKR
jgi:hypothetical protein